MKDDLDFVNEKPMKPIDIARHFRVSTTVVKTWFDRGLKCRYIRGKAHTTLEEVSRWANEQNDTPWQRTKKKGSE